MTNSSSVAIEHLRVERGGRVVIPDLSIEVRAGEVTGLLGPSGCGKTTLMRCIVGVQIVASGTVTVLGQPAGERPLRERVGYVTQASSVYDDLSVRENLAFFAAVLGVSSRAIAAAVEQVGLASSIDDLVSRLSGGQRSRVSLAVALLGRPDVLVLDEPTVGLDPVLRQQLWGTFAELAAEGSTIIVSSHVMDEAERCDRLLLMRDGELIADDPPQELRRRTRAPDVESAFLALVKGREAA